MIENHFPNLTEVQKNQFAALGGLYEAWNAKINVISRKDIENIEEKHVLHSLAIAKVIQFKPGTEILDIGTGGGFPGIPLAILFPDARFVLVDSIGKKITVVKEIAAALGLKNVEAHHKRVESIDSDFEFIVSRAVAPAVELLQWTKDKFSRNSFHNLKNGYLLLKGGDLQAELEATRKKGIKTWEIDSFFESEWFATKKVVYIPMT